MTKVFVFSQNVKLNSFCGIRKYIEKDDNICFLTTHLLFDNEQKEIEKQLDFCKISYLTFADLLDDKDNEYCDFKAYEMCSDNLTKYYNEIKRLKNELVIERLKSKIKEFQGYLICDDLGIDGDIFCKNGFHNIKLDYYYEQKKVNSIRNQLSRIKILSFIYHKLNKRKFVVTDDVYIAEKNNRKYIFIGKTGRIAYRLDLDLKKSEYERDNLQKGIYYKKDSCQYLTTLHECGKCVVPDSGEYDVRYIQDGYLPPNYSSLYLKFKPSNVQYYVWDKLGYGLFKNQDILAEILPFRKKLYIPEPKFPISVKNVLIAASGSGDWTAQKNRSDDDLMVKAFVEVARIFPDIQFIYRCHPTWTHPSHVGVNSINRVVQYLSSTGLTNIKLSSNIPQNSLDDYQLSFSRSSLDEDINQADLIFGEHSVSMLDGAFKGVPFASVNLTKRRNFFCGITQMGFSCCETVDDIVNVIRSITKKSYQDSYLRAVDIYNKMTDEE